jgi:hypothetical protein
MRVRKQFMIILVAVSLTLPQPCSPVSPRRGTLDSSGSCAGYPEVLCSRTFLVKDATGRPTTCLAVEYARRTPFPSQIQLASTAGSRRTRALLAGGGPISFDLKIPYTWITAGTWTAEGELLLVDSSLGELLRLTTSGHLTPISLGAQTTKVSDIRTIDDGMLLKLHDGRFVALDRQGKLQKVLDILTPEEKISGVHGIYNWAPLAGSILAFGDALTPSSSWTSGWMQIPLNNPTSFTMLTTASLSSLERRIYVMGDSYVASDGLVGYILIPGNPWSKVVKISRDHDGFNQQELLKIEDTPLSSRSRPLLPMGGTREDLVARFRALEQADAPVGVYVQGDNLYILTRRPLLPAGQTEWELSRLDKHSGQILGRVTLPTKANHLLVIPGKERWAFVEKGSVQALGHQEVKGLLLIPTNWIEQGQRGGRGYDVAIKDKEESPSPSAGGLSLPWKPAMAQ